MNDKERKRMQQELDEFIDGVGPTPREMFVQSINKAARAVTEAKQELLSWVYRIPGLGTQHRVYSAMSTLDHAKTDLFILLRELEEPYYSFGGVRPEEGDVDVFGDAEFEEER